MGWQDRKYNSGDYGEGGGIRRAFRRIFVEGDDFFSWALPLFRLPQGFPLIGGIDVRVHVLYIVYIATMLVLSMVRDRGGLPYTGAMMGTLFILVLLHEFGHCIACRWVGGEADRIVMWPLGGLAFCRPPHNWKAAFITTAGGPLVNVILIPVLGGALWLMGSGWEPLVRFNPFDPWALLAADWFGNYLKVWVWCAYFTNWALLLFNVLLIMFPLDGGRMFQEVLWWRLGYQRSMEIAVNVGLVLAICLGVFALLSNQNTLFSVALFAGITCFVERRKLAFYEEDNTLPGYDFSKGFKGMPNVHGKKYQNDPVASDKAYDTALKAQERERQRQEQVDKILDKIRREGMASLSRKEKAMLRDETERRKGQSA
jgi:Zn-dependent protease